MNGKLTLKLINFRLFDEATFEFNDSNTLILGPSGSGKSTVFMAMHFAVTGEGKKLVTYGKRSCSVTFQIGDTLEIVRTKGPCRLIVKDGDGRSYEDNEAQSVIDDTLPNWDLGYVSQKLYKGFIMMTPAEKLQYIERLTFSNYDIESIYKQCRGISIERKTDLTALGRERETIELMLREFRDDIVDCGDNALQPTECYDAEQISQLRSSISSIARQLDCKKKDLEFVETLKREIVDMTDRLDKRDNVSDMKGTIDMCNERYKYEQELKRLAAIEQELRRLNVISSAEIAYEAIVKKRQFDTTDDKLIDIMIRDFEEYERLKISLIDYESAKDDLDRFEQLTKDRLIKTRCPVCGGCVGFNDSCSLIAIDELACDNGYRLVSLEAANTTRIERERLTERVHSYNNVVDSIERVRSLYGISNCIISSRDLIELKAILKSRKTTMERKADCEKSCDRLRCDEIDARQIDAVESKIKLLESIESKQRYVSAANVEREDVADFEARLAELERKLSAANTGRYAKFSRRIRELKVSESDLDQRVSTIAKLQSLIKTAEKLALDDTIEQINLYAQIYLDNFTDDIHVKLTFDGRINVAVIYRGHETDLNALSGGELARVILAFTLALANINDVKLVLLDESFASLDEECSSTVLNSIKEHFTGKLICVSHQCSSGSFDNVVRLPLNFS